jgi:hypothetical protein
MSRIESARRRADAVKRGLAILAAASLVVAGVLARATNPGHAATASGSSSTVTSSGSDGSSSDDFSIAPSSSQPQVQTHVS